MYILHCLCDHTYTYTYTCRCTFISCMLLCIQKNYVKQYTCTYTHIYRTTARGADRRQYEAIEDIVHYTALDTRTHVRRDLRTASPVTEPEEICKLCQRMPVSPLRLRQLYTAQSVGTELRSSCDRQYPDPTVAIAPESPEWWMWEHTSKFTDFRIL